MIRKVSKREKINFLLENKHYQRLHLYLYLLSITIIGLIYFLGVILFSKYTNIVITTIFSITIGLYLLYKRDKLVKIISSKLHEKKIKKNKENNKKGLKTTLKRITPKNKNIKFNIKTKTPINEKIKNIKQKFNKKETKKNKVDYIEIK